MIDTVKIARIATAAAKAEGFFAPGPNLPQKCHNPGDLEIGNVGYGEDNGKTIFPSDNAGWMALRHEWDLILSGLSRAGYKLTDTIWQVADRWTGHDASATWAQSVAQSLGLSVTNTLQDYLNQP